MVLLEASRKEQEHRHDIDNEKLKIIGLADRRNRRVELWGMFFALLSLIVMMSISAVALYLDHPWFAGLFGFSSIVSIISIFVNRGKGANQDK